MVLNCIKSNAMTTQIHRGKLIFESLIFLVLLVLAGIGIATGSERGGHDSATLRTALVASPQERSFDGWGGRNEVWESRAGGGLL
jgi:hypothetical protein